MQEQSFFLRLISFANIYIYLHYYNIYLIHHKSPINLSSIQLKNRKIEDVDGDFQLDVTEPNLTCPNRPILT